LGFKKGFKEMASGHFGYLLNRSLFSPAHQTVSATALNRKFGTVNQSLASNAHKHVIQMDVAVPSLVVIDAAMLDDHLVCNLAANVLV
jgi:hypothetical protein